MATIKVDHVIVGAGLAGLVLYRMLRGHKRVVIVDPSPGNWKIGEANVPEMFASPIFSGLMQKIRRLPSFSQKNGSVFIGDDSFAVYPITTNTADAVHVARDELEQLMVAEWNVPVSRERVESIDIAGRVVRTDKNTYEMSGPVIDCSGAAMLVARTLGQVQRLWPISSVWRYYDVDSLEPAAFLRHMRETNRPGLVLDIPNIKRFPDEMLDTWAPHEATNLTKVEDGTWMWQIPLFGAKMLSVGLVSRRDDCGPALLDSAVEQHHARCYRLSPRPLDESSVYNRLHQRQGFALRAGQAASLDYILIGDAFMFVDPVYSVGTSLAVNKALEVAALLVEHGWSERACAAFNARAEALIARRIAAFGYWYSESVRQSDENTARVQQYFPEMTKFQAGITWQYARVVQATLKLTGEVQAATSRMVKTSGLDLQGP